MNEQFYAKHAAKVNIGAALIIANAAYLTRNVFCWVLTLAFFLIVPGYLFLSKLKHGFKSPWEIGSISLGLSLLLMMCGGIALNSLRAFGLHKPLDTINIFAMLDVVTVALLSLVPDKDLLLPWPKLAITVERAVSATLLTSLPLLAMFGAFRLNNGASNILTMVLFAAIPLLFMWLVGRRKQLESLFPYAVLMFSLAVLLSTSLRGWFITGHDIQHEFKVFQITSKNAYWNTALPKGDPYNACLSITILPTILAKITGITAPYIYKAVFQIIFAFGLVPLYLLIKRFGKAWMALAGALAFISFPTFLNDIPFLNRQEMAFIFFGLLLLVTFHDMRRRAKTILTMLTLLGLILSHYSSGYITIGLLALSWLFFKALTFRRSNWQSFLLPTLSLPIITVALLFTFFWNAQITGTTSNLRQAISQTISGILGNSTMEASGVSYSILAPHAQSPAQVLAEHTGADASQVKYVAPKNLPTTDLGKAVSHIVNVKTLNDLLRSFAAKIFQLLLLMGVVILFLRHARQKSAKETYFYSLVHSSVMSLILITILPGISVDYSVTRMFQQTLIITALPIVLAAAFVFSSLGRYKVYITSLFFALLFLDLSGFVPQILGGYPPQLALNNAGTYYDIYYTHESEILSYSWLAKQSKGEIVTMDFYTKGRVTQTPINASITNPLTSKARISTYLLQGYANTRNETYGTFLSGDVIEYSYPGLTRDASRVYANQSSRVFMYGYLNRSFSNE